MIENQSWFYNSDDPRLQNYCRIEMEESQIKNMAKSLERVLKCFDRLRASTDSQEYTFAREGLDEALVEYERKQLEGLK